MNKPHKAVNKAKKKLKVQVANYGDELKLTPSWEQKMPKEEHVKPLKKIKTKCQMIDEFNWEEIESELQKNQKQKPLCNNDKDIVCHKQLDVFGKQDARTGFYLS